MTSHYLLCYIGIVWLLGICWVSIAPIIRDEIHRRRYRNRYRFHPHRFLVEAIRYFNGPKRH